MKRCVSSLCLFLGLFFVSPASLFSNTSLLINRIQGQVFDQHNTPVPDADVELLNEVDSLLTRTKTNSAGLFSFLGVSSGRFQVRVIPFRTNLLGETKDVEVTPLRPGGSDTVYVDFYLRVDKRTLGNVLEGPPGAVFVQAIPDDARRLYESGIKKLEKDQEDGFSDLEEAVKIFPIYFDALSALGKGYISNKQYEKGYPYLLRALDVNQKSAGIYYSLAYAFYQLKQVPAAVKAARACVVLNGASVDSQLLLGTVLRINGDYKEAEKALLKSNDLAKKKNAEVHWQLALLYNRLNRNNEAADELQAYLKLNPNNPDKKQIEELMGKLRVPKQS